MMISKVFTSREGNQPGTLSQRVYSGLRQEILQCTLKPGQLIYESELIQKYEVSKTPVREALKRLSQERYIQSVPGSCYIVAPITVRDVVEIFDLRTILEEAAAARATKHATDSQLAQLELSVGEVCLLQSRDELIRWYDANNAFHLLLARLSGNSRLEQAICAVLEEMTRFLLLDRKLPLNTERWVMQHRSIVEALRTRNMALTMEAAHAHIVDSKIVIEQSLSARFG